MNETTNPDAASSGFFIRRRAVAGILCALIIWSIATGYLAYRVLNPIQAAPNPKDIIARFNTHYWGINSDPKTNERVSAVVDATVDNIGPMAQNYRLVGVARVADDTTDINTDTRVDRSSEFTIVPGTTRIEIPLSTENRRRISSGGRMDIMVIALPRMYSANQIASLSTLESLHGQIVIHQGVAVPPRDSPHTKQ